MIYLNIAILLPGYTVLIPRDGTPVIRARSSNQSISTPFTSHRCLESYTVSETSWKVRRGDVYPWFIIMTSADFILKRNENQKV
jgi:hypothetical protein